MLRLAALLLALAPAPAAADMAEALKLAEAPVLPRDPRSAIAVLEPALAEALRAGDVRAASKLSKRLGDVYWLPMGDFPRAYEAYQTARRADHALEDRKAEAEILDNLAKLTAVFGDWAKGAGLYEDAAALAGAAGIEDARRRYLEEAARFHRRLDENEGGAPVAVSSSGALGQAWTLLGAKDYAGADALFSAHNARYADMKRGPGWRPQEHLGRGLALEGLGRRREAEGFFRLAWDAALVKHARWRLDGNDSYFTFGVEPAEGLVRVADDEEAFYFAEAGRARVLVKALGARRGASLAPLTGELAAREAALAARPDAKELERFVADARRARPDYAAARYPRPLRAADIPLAKDEVLLEYEVTAPSAKVFVVKGGRVAAARTIPASRRELAALVREYRAFFDDVRSAADLARFDAAVGRRLADLLLRPVLKYVPKGAKVIVVPDEFLSALPFEALVLEAPERGLMPSGRRGPAPTGVRYAGDVLDISYAASATALASARALKRARRAPDALFVLADPVFDPSDPRARGVAMSSGRREVRDAMFKSMGLAGGRRGASDSKSASRETAAYPRLDKTSLLAAALADKIFAGKRTRSLLGADAAEAAVKAEDLSRFRYLVFATHGILDGSSPYLREPALVLGQTAAGAEDGFLTMGEVAKLDLDADLVALTACQTGLGRGIRGEGTLGLVRAFQLAGADQVLVSLWNVSEDSTTELARSFFARLNEGLPARAALRAARADVRRQGYEHPFYWAPFILAGD